MQTLYQSVNAPQAGGTRGQMMLPAAHSATAGPHLEGACPLLAQLDAIRNAGLTATCQVGSPAMVLHGNAAASPHGKKGQPFSYGTISLSAKWQRRGEGGPRDSCPSRCATRVAHQMGATRE